MLEVAIIGVGAARSCPAGRCRFTPPSFVSVSVTEFSGKQGGINKLPTHCYYAYFSIFHPVGNGCSDRNAGRSEADFTPEASLLRADPAAKFL